MGCFVDKITDSCGLLKINQTLTQFCVVWERQQFAEYSRVCRLYVGPLIMSIHRFAKYIYVRRVHIGLQSKLLSSTHYIC